MTSENQIKPAATAEGLDGGRCAVDAGFGSGDFIDRITGALARVESETKTFVTWTSGGFRFVTRRDIFMQRYSPLPNIQR